MKTFRIFMILVALVCMMFQSCGNETKETKTAEVVAKPSFSDTTKVLQKPEKAISYSISVVQIDSSEFYLVKNKSSDDKPLKIIDINQVKKLLKGIVEFSEDESYGESQAVMGLKFRNGKTYKNPNEYDLAFFVAYFPEEDILLCEGGHSTEVSFNLKNGKQTKDTGNPDLIVTSPLKELRLNGHYDGQDCFFYFIERKVGKEFEKIVQLDTEFRKKTKMMLCDIGDAVWENENTLLIYRAIDYTGTGVNKGFFKIRIEER